MTFGRSFPGWPGNDDSLVEFLGTSSRGGHPNSTEAFVKGQRRWAMVEVDGWPDQVNVVTNVSRDSNCGNLENYPLEWQTEIKRAKEFVVLAEFRISRWVSIDMVLGNEKVFNLGDGRVHRNPSFVGGKTQCIFC